MRTIYKIIIPILTILIPLTACSVNGAATETTAMAAESSTDETMATAPEIPEETEPTTSDHSFSGDLVTYTVGAISIQLPEYYLSEDYSQKVQGMDIKMTYFSDPEQIQHISIGYIDIGEENKGTYDIEHGLQMGIDSMVASAESDVGFARILSETETQQIELAGRTWWHRNVVISAGRERFTSDIYVMVIKERAVVNVALFNTDGTNEDFVNRLDSIISINEL